MTASLSAGGHLAQCLKEGRPSQAAVPYHHHHQEASPSSQAGAVFSVTTQKEGSLRLVLEEPSPDTSSSNCKASSERKKTIYSPALEHCEETNLCVGWDPTIWDGGGLGSLSRGTADLLLPHNGCHQSQWQSLLPAISPCLPL